MQSKYIFFYNKNTALALKNLGLKPLTLSTLALNNLDLKALALDTLARLPVFILSLFILTTFALPSAQAEERITSWPPSQTANQASTSDNSQANSQGAKAQEDSALSNSGLDKNKQNSSGLNGLEGEAQNSSETSPQAPLAESSTGQQEDLANKQAGGQGRNIFKRSPSSSSPSVMTLTPSTALRDAPTDSANKNLYMGSNATLSSWSANATRALVGYEEAGPAPGSETMPQLVPLQ